jgi:hypothetical protein
VPIFPFVGTRGAISLGCKFTLYRAKLAPQGVRSPKTNHHGQPEKETSSEDEQAQAPEALEGESPQEAHVAEVSGGFPAIHWAHRP